MNTERIREIYVWLTFFLHLLSPSRQICGPEYVCRTVRQVPIHLRFRLLVFSERLLSGTKKEKPNLLRGIGSKIQMVSSEADAPDRRDAYLGLRDEEIREYGCKDRHAAKYPADVGAYAI